MAVGRGHGGLSLGLRASSAVSVASGGHRGRFGSTHACAKIPPFPPFPPFPRGWSVSAWARRASTSGALQRRVVARESRWRARPKSAAAAACRGQRGLPAYPSPWPSERGVQIQRCGADRNSSRAALRQCAQNRAAARRRPRRAAQGMRCRILRPGRHAPEHSAAQRGRAGGRKPSEWMRRSGRRSFDFVLFVWCSSVVPRPVGESGMLSTCERARTTSAKQSAAAAQDWPDRVAAARYRGGLRYGLRALGLGLAGTREGGRELSRLRPPRAARGAPRRRTARAAWGLNHRPRRAPAVHKPTGLVSEGPPARSALPPSLATTGGLVAYRMPPSARCGRAASTLF